MRAVDAFTVEAFTAPRACCRLCRNGTRALLTALSGDG